jgi:YfiH family protein
MIRPPGLSGAAFGSAVHGNGRDDPEARSRISALLGIPDAWAWMGQVHGASVIRARRPGRLGEGDAAFTTVAGLPLVVATADCLPVVLEGRGGVGIAHAGWRGVVGGVVEALRGAMTAAGVPPTRAAIGPGIGPCCFEVGPDVAARFAGHRVVSTLWGTESVHLSGAVRDRLAGLEVWAADECTMCNPEYRSYRRDATEERQVGVAWLRSD